SRGRDWVLPGAYGSAARRLVKVVPGVPAWGAGLAAVAASLVGTGLAVAATAGAVSGRARAAAQVTPIEEARNPCMLLSLDIAI
ncbi:hypothetical protein ACSNOJ_36300, partial [Streptomyces sp. URMC 128]|uniref:hypothetical protein n=1 Tax=Streptomyces sp. URMC 128 TaxID=3423404 RepID=UPI003F1A3688